MVPFLTCSVPHLQRDAVDLAVLFYIDLFRMEIAADCWFVSLGDRLPDVILNDRCFSDTVVNEELLLTCNRRAK